MTRQLCRDLLFASSSFSFVQQTPFVLLGHATFGQSRKCYAGSKGTSCVLCGSNGNAILGGLMLCILQMKSQKHDVHNNSIIVDIGSVIVAIKKIDFPNPATIATSSSGGEEKEDLP